jgi:hypothetical protein
LPKRARRPARSEWTQIAPRDAGYASGIRVPGRCYCNGRAPECRKTQQGLEAALEDFASDVSEIPETPDLGEISSDALILEDEPAVAVAVVEATDSAMISEIPQDAEIVEVELAPLEAGDDFDDVFVELIEE